MNGTDLLYRAKTNLEWVVPVKMARRIKTRRYAYVYRAIFFGFTTFLFMLSLC